MVARAASGAFANTHAIVQGVTTITAKFALEEVARVDTR